MICLDTSILIEYFRKSKKENSFLYELSKKHNHFSVSVITEFEIYSGSNEVQRDFWIRFFEQVEVLPFESETSILASSIFQDLKQKNKLIEMPDLLIAATALQHHIPLATLNVRHFERVKNLELVTI